MPVSYNKLWKLLIDKKMKRTDLITMADLSSATLAKMGKDQQVSIGCNHPYLQCPWVQCRGYYGHCSK